MVMYNLGKWTKITQSELQDLVSYRSDGSLIWKISTSNRIKKGDIVGWKSSNGYIRCKIKGIEGPLHHFIWLYHYGEFPAKNLDHINQNRRDNRIENLREATYSENLINTKLSKRNTSRFRGVYLNQNNNTYYWQLVKDYKVYSGAGFSTPEEAAIERNKKSFELYGQFEPNLNTTVNSGKWSNSRFKSFITSLIRAGSRKWGPRNLAKLKARNPYKLKNKNGRYVYHSLCAKCNKLIPETESTVDHINPVVDPNVGFVDWDTYIKRMFCEVDGFQVLCKPCHKNKTDEEKDVAKRRRKNIYS